MIRQPSTYRALYAWHRAALAGAAPPIHDGMPECGWYRLRRSRGGAWLPARIWCHQEIDHATGELTADEYLRAEVDGIEKSPLVIWTYLTPISRADFDRLTDQLLRVPGLLNTGHAFDLTLSPARP